MIKQRIYDGRDKWHARDGEINAHSVLGGLKTGEKNSIGKT
jgi:hypothetical protein